MFSYEIFFRAILRYSVSEQQLDVFLRYYSHGGEERIQFPNLYLLAGIEFMLKDWQTKLYGTEKIPFCSTTTYQAPCAGSLHPATSTLLRAA